MSDNQPGNLPKVSRLESFLDSRDMVKNPIHIFEKYRNEHGANFMFHFGGAKRTFVTSDPPVVQHILKDNNSNYNKSDIQVKRMAEFQGLGLLNSHGEYWFKQRRLLSKGFSNSHLTKIFPYQVEVLKEFLNDFDRRISNGAVDINSEMVKFTLRFVGKSLFGSMMKDEVIERIGESITNIQEFMVKQIVQPYMIPWFRISGQSGKYQQMRRESDKLIMDYVNERRNEGSDADDMLKMILQTPYIDSKEFMSDEQVMIEILQLLVAGNETSSNVLSWTFYLLAKHPEYIEQIRSEVNGVYGSGELNYEGFRKLKNTINILNEAMRMYPPFWMVDRISVNDDEINDFFIPKNTMVSVYIYGVHHNEEVWNKPFDFNPSRFNADPGNQRHQFAHVPFGGGPRVCIGQNMAMMQILLVLVSIVRNYNFSLATDKPVGIHPMMILRPDGPIQLKFDRIG